MKPNIWVDRGAVLVQFGNGLIQRVTEDGEVDRAFTLPGTAWLVYYVERDPVVRSMPDGRAPNGHPA